MLYNTLTPLIPKYKYIIGNVFESVSGNNIHTKPISLFTFNDHANISLFIR